jgi:hypothetical protein
MELATMGVGELGVVMAASWRRAMRVYPFSDDRIEAGLSYGSCRS